MRATARSIRRVSVRDYARHSRANVSLLTESRNPALVAIQFSWQAITDFFEIAVIAIINLLQNGNRIVFLYRS